MAKLIGFKIPHQFMVGAVLGIFTPVLIWLISFITPLRDFLGKNIGLSTDLGVKINMWLVGTSSTTPDLIIAAVSGGLLVMLGTWIYNMDWSPNKIPGMSEKFGKPTLVLFYASAAVAIVLSLPTFGIPPLTTFVVMAVNSLITAWFLVTVLGDQLQLA